jgi:hypothetical protein
LVEAELNAITLVLSFKAMIGKSNSQFTHRSQSGVLKEKCNRSRELLDDESELVSLLQELLINTIGIESASIIFDVLFMDLRYKVSIY